MWRTLSASARTTPQYHAISCGTYDVSVTSQHRLHPARGVLTMPAAAPAPAAAAADRQPGAATPRYALAGALPVKCEV